MKNQYETLIEYIINNQEDKARALFHNIVVAKSRDIYESLMDQDQMAETVDQYDQGASLEDEVSSEETMEGDDEFGDDMGDGMDDMGDDMGDGMDDGMDDMGDGMDDMGADGDTEEKFQNIKDAIADLEAEFAGLMGDDDTESDMDMDDDMDDDMDGGMDDDMESTPAMEAENPFAKKGSGMSGSGKSGSGMSGSGKSGSGMSGSGKSGSGNPFAKKGSGSGKMSEVDLMREYVEKITAGHGAEKSGEAEGKEIGKSGSSFTVNKSNPVAGKNDMGGTATNMVSGRGADTSAITGDKPNAKVGGFMKAPVAVPGSERNVNQVGGNKGAQTFYKTKEKAKSSEGSTTDGSVPVKKDSLGFPNK
jgi:hypothetical protein